MKKIITISLILGMVLLVSSCTSFIAGLAGFNVDPPASADSSLVLVELIAYTAGEAGTETSSLMKNTVQSGFYPVVFGPDGTEIPFKHIDALSEAGLVFFLENIPSGLYSLEGFRYVWMTDNAFLNSPIKELKFDGQRTDMVERNFYPLPSPVKIEIKPGTTASFGRYKVYYELKELDSDTKLDDGTRMVLFSYDNILPNDTNLLDLIEKWQYGSWPDWNARKVQ
jgi:hypothetical protein